MSRNLNNVAVRKTLAETPARLVGWRGRVGGGGELYVVIRIILSVCVYIQYTHKYSLLYVCVCCDHLYRHFARSLTGGWLSAFQEERGGGRIVTSSTVRFVGEKKYIVMPNSGEGEVGVAWCVLCSVQGVIYLFPGGGEGGSEWMRYGHAGAEFLVKREEVIVQRRFWSR